MLGTRRNRFAVIGGKTRGLGSSGKQAACLEIEGLKPSPETGAPNDRQGHQSVTPATDRGHDDPPAQPQDALPVYPPRQKVCRFPGAVYRQGHRRGCPSLSVMAGLDRDVGGNRQRQRHCTAVLLQDHTETPRSCRGAHLDPRASPPARCSGPEEVGRLLAAATNIKHKAILSLAYATGLRASEVVSLKLTDIDRDRMLIRVEQGKSLPSRRRGARRIGTSFSRPSCLRYCMNGGASRARRAGCLPVSPGCFPATAGSIRVRASCIGSFAWQPGVPASPSGSAFIRCGTASPRISWSRRPIFG